MGNFLSILSSGRHILELSYLDCSSMKLREYYASFKLICEGFTLDSTEFSQIFGPSVNAFSVWDVERRRRIDALEMFSGLILFSNARFDDKVQFLFEVFDLNEQGWLCFESLQFLLLNCMNASYRICQIQQRASDEQIEAFLSEYFCSDSQVDLPKLRVWASRLPEVREFFQLISKEMPQQQPKEAQPPVESELFQSKVYNNFKNSAIGTETGSYAQLSKLSCLNFGGAGNVDGKYFNPRPSWVFGMRIEDVKEPLRCIVSAGEKAANEKLLYFVGRVAIVYYIKLACQQFYLEHQQEISCLVVGKCQLLAATGQLSNQPSIHVWSIKNRNNVMVLNNCHRRPISHLLFFRNDKGLVSASHHQSGLGAVVLVHSLEDGSSLFSCYLEDTVVSLLTVGWALLTDSSSFSVSNTISDKSSGQSTIVAADHEQSFLLVSQFAMLYYSLQKDGFVKHFFPIGKQPITCALATNCLGVVLTGHENGTVIKWKRFSQPHELFRIDEQQPAVVSIVQSLDPHQYCVLTAHSLYIVNVQTAEISQCLIPTELYRLRMVQMLQLRNTHLLLLGLLGQLIKVKLGAEPTFDRLPYSFRFEDIKASSYCKDDGMLYLASTALVFKIDTAQNELRCIHVFEPQIRCLSANSDRVVVGLSNGEILVSQGHCITERYKVGDAIVDICVRTAHILVLTERGLELFMVVDGKYFSKTERKALLEGYHATKLQPTLNEKIYVISTREGDLLRIDLELKYSVISANQRLPIEFLHGTFNNISFLYSKRHNLNIASSDNGALAFFNSAEEMLEGPDTNHQELLLHAGPISNILYIGEPCPARNNSPMASQPLSFVTVGSIDQMVVVWANSPVLKDQLEARGLPKSRIKLEQISSKEYFVEESKGAEQEGIKDSQIRINMILDPSIERLVQHILIPSKKSSYEAQVNHSKIHVKHLPPAASLKLSYVYGLETNSCRNSVAYCHVYYEGPSYKRSKVNVLPKSKPAVSNTKSVKIPEQLKAQIEVSSQMLLPYTQSHASCNKYVLYFTDRLVVRYCPSNKQQRFYQQHRKAVSCIAVHPHKRIICSAERPSKELSYARLHIWDCKTFEKLRAETVEFPGTVKQLEFSRDGAFIGCVIQCRQTSSIGVLDWQNVRWVAHRSLSLPEITDMKFDPYKRQQLAVSGNNFLAIYSCSSGTLLMKQQAVLQHNETIACLNFISNSYGTSIESDILTGDNQGNIGLFICGKFLTVREKAHKGNINCLKVGELFKYKTVLITAGEDEMVRIWDTKVNLIIELNIRQLTCLSSLPKHANFQPQSLDLYHCNQSSTEDALTVLLVCIRNGDVLEALIENEYRGLQLYVDERCSPINAKDTPRNSEIGTNQKQRQSINLKWNVLLKGYPSGSAVKAAAHWNKLATATAEHQLLLWDISCSQIASSVDIKGTPTVLKFSHSGQMLALGYSTGELTLYDVVGFTLVQFHQTSHLSYSVLSLQFSESDCKLAVSLVPIKGTRQKIPYVEILSIKGSSKRVELLTVRQTDRISKLLQILNRSNGTAAVIRMNFSANQNENHLLLWYQPSNRGDGQVKYTMWDLEKNQQRKSIDGTDCNSLNFSTIVRLKYMRTETEELECSTTTEVRATDMAQVGSTLVMSSSNGEVVLARIQCFYSSELAGQEWALSRTYRAHASEVSAILNPSFDTNEIYTVGAGNCIMKWSLQEEKESWDYDYLNNSTMADPFEEPLTKQRLDNQLLSLLPKRKSIFEVVANQEFSTNQPRTYLKLRSVIGRNAYLKRNNILSDFNDTLITYAGCNLMLIKKEGEELKQEFIKVDSSEFSVLPEISAISISADRRLLFIGTCEQNAKIVTWDIGSRTCLSLVVLKDILEVRCVRACKSSGRLAAVCLSTNNQTRLLYLTQDKVLASYNFDYSLNTKVHELCFVPGESAKFVTCGLHHLAEWRYNSHLLCYQTYKLEDPNKQGFINTYCFVYVRQSLVSGSEDGFLYVWENKKIAKRQEAHPKSAILALHCSNDSKIFASGGTDGKVILWQLTSNILQKLYEYSMNEGPILTRSALVRHHVQSISIGSSKVVVGTRSGDILQFERPGQSQYSEQQKSAAMLLPAFDHEEVISIRFSPSSKNMYVLTKAGTLSVVELETLKKKQQCQVDLHDKELLRMFVCQVTEHIILVFTDEIQIFDSLRKHNELIKLAYCRCSRINDAALSTNQHYLAVLIAANQTENAKLLVYTLNIKAKKRQERREQSFEPNRSDAFSLYHTVENLSANVEFIDFSTDNEYLTFKNRDDSDNLVVRLLSKQRVNLQSSEFHVEWAGAGKKTLEKIRAVCSYYNQDNKMLGLAQIMDKCVVATDQMGSLRIFSYPVLADRGYYHCLIEHLNDVGICLTTPECKWLVTYSPVDRCINIWEVNLCESTDS